MKRRDFILSGLAFGLIGPSATASAAPFAPARFSVEIRGRGPDVILIPGLTSGRHAWRPTAEAVAGYRYHLIQVAGFAGDPARANAEGPVVGPLADEIARYIRSRGLVRPAIVGHSMGGTLAMIIAARHPQLAGRIMVVDMLPQPAGLLGGSAANIGPLAGQLQRYLATPGGRRLFDSFMTVFSPPGSINSRSDPDVTARAMHELAGMDLTPLLPGIRVPMTVVYASPDPRANVASDRTFARAYAAARGARLVRIDNAGHMVMLDRPTRFRAIFREFLTR